MESLWTDTLYARICNLKSKMNFILHQILNWICKNWFQLDVKITLPIVQAYIRLVQKYIKTRGIFETIKRLKVHRNIVTKYICGQPIKVHTEIVGIKDGFPKAIMFLKDFIDSGNRDQMRFAMTLLGVSRTLAYKAKADYSSVVKPFDGKYQKLTDQRSIDFMETFVKDFNLYVIREEFTPKTIFFTMKAGPLGHALLTSLNSLTFVNGPMLAAFRALSGTKYCMYLKDLLKTWRDKIKTEGVDKKLSDLGINPTNRRLSIVNDPEA
jgi:hypothetical protein